jgi:hypothetical protein
MPDGDIHLAIRGLTSSSTMVVEFPDPRCTLRASAADRLLMSRARAAILRVCALRQKTRHFRGTVRVIGVLFFDLENDSDTQAMNTVELHPVTGFRLLSRRCIFG